MKLEVTKAWCLAATRREGDVEIGAGVTAFDPEPTMKSEAQGHAMLQRFLGQQDTERGPVSDVVASGSK